MVIMWRNHLLLRMICEKTISKARKMDNTKAMPRDMAALTGHYHPFTSLASTPPNPTPPPTSTLSIMEQLGSIDCRRKHGCGYRLAEQHWKWESGTQQWELFNVFSGTRQQQQQQQQQQHSQIIFGILLFRRYHLDSSIRGIRGFIDASDDAPWELDGGTVFPSEKYRQNWRYIENNPSYYPRLLASPLIYE